MSRSFEYTISMQTDNKITWINSKHSAVIVDGREATEHSQPIRVYVSVRGHLDLLNSLISDNIKVRFSVMKIIHKLSHHSPILVKTK